jgi:hypothetical protein
MKLYFNYTELICLDSALKLLKNSTITSVKKKQTYYEKNTSYLMHVRKKGVAENQK